MHPRFDYSHYEIGCRDRQWNRALLAEYLPHFTGCRRVLDLACGPGLFLELLAEQGISAVGVEHNTTVVEVVRSQGLEVVEQDVFSFLTQVRERYDGIFCSHFIEHLPFERVLDLIELIVPTLEPGGTLVLVFPNPESIRMQLFGFWRDPEHVRFYHPELIEAVCKHYGLLLTHTNCQEAPFAIPTVFPQRSPIREEPGEQKKKRGWLRQRMREPYLRLLRALRLVPYTDMLALEQKLREEIDTLPQILKPWTETATWAINRMWAWPDNAALVCRKPSEEKGEFPH
jgi:O-antigen chain-terminating methyltransferase